ncbi:hypothetical protein IC213_18265 [Clostridioides sp. ES-S-0049-02]|uniref:hypothetical protein n=1 Tax=Clostridioides sp. ES-S-0049-02 TaxID=2770778 RepID=UPI001D10C98B|nr:hypothetical protein [Clostridioides sp. ES-S-0049-02]
MLENLLMNCLGIEEREEFRGINEGKNRKINLNLNCDRAFVRCRFRRYLLKTDKKVLIMRDSAQENTKFYFDSWKLDLSSVEDINKVITVIENWIKYTIDANKSEPYKICFE